MENFTKISLLIASYLGSDFDFNLHESILLDVIAYGNVQDDDIDKDHDFVMETISVNASNYISK